MTQPDWCLGLLLGALLGTKYDWPWILPALCVHDLVLFWSLNITFPYIFMVVLLLGIIDKRLGCGQPQRWVGLVLGCIPLLWAGLSMLSGLMTMLLTVGVWFWLSTQQRDRDYVEST
ncbi:MAG: hypothetical protein R8M45_06305 [Ghiorsea sp.]